nr:expressed conserved protein [Hymenolepis microstoma]
MRMSANLQGKFCAILLVSVFLICSASAEPRRAFNDAEVAKIIKLREFLNSMDDEDVARLLSERSTSYSKRWSPIRQFRGGLLEV